MKLTKLTAANIKGSTFEETLTDIVLYHGKNECGKSTRIETLTLALCKCLPGTATRPADIYELLASGTEMTCYTEADTGAYAGGTWSKGRKGIETAFEGELEAPRLLFSTSEFLDLTPKERTKFLFAVLPPPDLEKVGPSAIIANLKNVKMEPHTEAHEAAIKEFSGVVADSYVLQNSQQRETFTVQNWLAAIVEDIATRTKEAKASAKTMRQTALGTVAMRQDAPALGPVEAAKRKAQESLTTAVQSEANALNDFSNAEAKVQEAKAVASKLVDETNTKQQIAKLESEIGAAAQVAPAGLEPVEAGIPTPRPNAVGELANKNVMQAHADTAQRAVADWSAKVTSATAELARAKAQTSCPTCGHDITDQQKQVIKKIQDKLDVATVAHAKANEMLEHNMKAFILASNSLKAAQEACDEWDKQNIGIQTGNRTARAEWNNRQTTYNLAQSQINILTAQIGGLNTALAANQTAREAAAALPLLVTASQEAAGRYTEAKNARVTAKGILDAAEATYRTALADAAAARNAQQATEQAEAIEAKAAVGQELRDMLDELLKECIKMSIGPLVDLANSLCEGILSAPLTFTDGEIQMVKPTGAHSHRSMSGSSKALAYCALNIALAASSPIRLVVLDELSRLDAGRQTKLVNRLGILIKSGKIHQAILASPTPVTGFEMPEGVTFTQVKIG